MRNIQSGTNYYNHTEIKRKIGKILKKTAKEPKNLIKYYNVKKRKKL